MWKYVIISKDSQRELARASTAASARDKAKLFSSGSNKEPVYIRSQKGVNLDLYINGISVRKKNP